MSYFSSLFFLILSLLFYIRLYNQIMEEELYPIEQDDETVAAAVQQVVEEQNRAAAILQEQ